DTLKSQGKRVVCYFSAGSSENWRSDYSQFTAADQGNPLDGWAGERWLDTRSANVRRIMTARMDLAKSKGCDGIDPDNVDGYTNNPGLPLTA
ncbi:endo alpha-1,4 polygalactosaminidase, partial [Burkholderia sp. SIMBA_042]